MMFCHLNFFLLVYVVLGGRKARGAGTLEGALHHLPTRMSISVSAIVLGNHTQVFCGIFGKPLAMGLALTASHNLHAVLASCALLDSSKEGLCCDECRSY